MRKSFNSSRNVLQVLSNAQLNAGRHNQPRMREAVFNRGSCGEGNFMHRVDALQFANVHTFIYCQKLLAKFAFQGVHRRLQSVDSRSTTTHDRCVRDVLYMDKRLVVDMFTNITTFAKAFTFYRDRRGSSNTRVPPRL
eukprot:TRINITY_DN76679_c0_g1_i1.p1 TRINITY_DN76679_c0_g1~~TRINITY_DN76679_c0_g1_i1.p1  ORF type:complete len:138 (+),score=7.44 TRINITY_DN76679_c0_g1_i1:343-756(+)